VKRFRLDPAWWCKHPLHLLHPPHRPRPQHRWHRHPLPRANYCALRLAEWITQLTAPPGPELERPELVRWWAEGRYRRFVAQGLRGGLVPIAQDIANPAQRAQRLKQLEAVLAQRFDESGRPTDPVKGFELNALRMRSTPCILQAEPGAVTYRYERTRVPNQLLAAAYCSAEQITDWSQDVVPGLSWTHGADKPPNMARRSAQ
jgi:hypothetical protein